MEFRALAHELEIGEDERFLRVDGQNVAFSIARRFVGVFPQKLLIVGQLDDQRTSLAAIWSS